MKLWGYVNEARSGEIAKTRVDSQELKWPWVEVPREVNTTGVKAWRFDARDGTWKRRYLVVLSVSVPRIAIDSEEHADVMIVVPDEDDFQVVKQWKDLRVWIEGELYELAPGELVEVSAHMPKRIPVRLDDPRVYSERAEMTIMAVEPVPALELEEKNDDP